MARRCGVNPALAAPCTAFDVSCASTTPASISTPSARNCAPTSAEEANPPLIGDSFAMLADAATQSRLRRLRHTLQKIERAFSVLPDDYAPQANARLGAEYTAGEPWIEAISLDATGTSIYQFFSALEDEPWIEATEAGSGNVTLPKFQCS